MPGEGDFQDVRLQSANGDVSPFQRKDQAMGGMIAIARIIKVHHKHHTVDIQLIVNKDTYVGTTIKNGIDAVQLGERQAGWDKKYEVYYGDITPYRVGQLVVVIFAEHMKDRPFVLGTVHEVKHERNPFPVEPYNEADEKHIYERLHITRLQDYWYYNGVSEFEFVHHSHFYMVSRENGRNSNGIDDARSGFNFEDLYVKHKKTGKTLTMPEEKRKSIPLDYMFNLAKGPEPDDGFLRFWFRSKDAETRMSQDLNDNKLSMAQLSKDGAFKVRRQLDTNVRGAGSDYADVTILADGTVIVERTQGAEYSKITVTPVLIHMETKDILMEARQDITGIAQRDINFTAGRDINLTAGRQIYMKAPKVIVDGDFYTINGSTYLECD